MSLSNTPYHLDPGFETAVVLCCLTSPEFMRRIGHAIDPDQLTGAPRILVRAAQLIMATTGKGPTSPALALQRLNSLCWDGGKLSMGELDAARQWCDAHASDPAPDIDGVIGELAPKLKQRMTHEAATLMYGRVGRGGDTSQVVKLLQTADNLGSADSAGLVLTRLTLDMADAPPVRWLWRHRLAAGVSHVVFGAGGAGKSSALRNVAARVAMGAPMPGEDSSAGEPRAVLIIGHEDTEAQIAADLADAGCDAAAVSRVLTVRTSPRLPEQVPELERLIADNRAALVIIERFALKGSDAKTEFVRPAMDALADLAERTGAAIVTIKHANKGGDSTRNALSGSTAWEDAARHVLYVTKAPDDPDLRLIVVSKTNLGPVGPAIGVRRTPDMSIDDTDTAAGDASTGRPPRPRYRMEWDTTIEDISANDLRRAERALWAETGKGKGKRDDGRALFTFAVRNLLERGPMAKDVLKARLAEFGVTPTVYQMDTTLRSFAEPFKSTDGRTLWRLTDMPPGVSA